MDARSLSPVFGGRGPVPGRMILESRQVYRTAKFRYQGNVEWRHDQDDHVVEPGGKSLADAIVAVMREGGVHVSDVEQHEDFGWAFEAKADGGAFYQVLNAPSADEVYLTVQADVCRGGTPSNALEPYCGRLRAAIEAVPGVAEVEWEAWRT
jgi:hypothetical protein